MSDIFMSYAREDLEAARRLASALESQGWSVFWDRRDIPAGKAWREVIGAALADARCVVVLWSQHSVNSDRVLEEADYGSWRRALIPVLIETVEPPLGFRIPQAADLSTWAGDHGDAAIQQFLRMVAGVLGPAPAVSVEYSPAAEAEAPRKADEQRPQQAEAEMAEAKRKAEEQPRQQAEAEAKLNVDEQQRQQAEARAERKAAGEPYRVEAEAQRKADEDRKRVEVEARHAAEVLPKGLTAAIAARQYELSALRRRRVDESVAKAAEQHDQHNFVRAIVWGALCALGLAIGFKLGVNLLALFGTTRNERSSNRKISKRRTYPVDCSVYAPREVPRGRMILVQVFLHPPQLSDKAAVAAVAFDTSAVHRGFASLNLDLAEDERIGFELRAPDLIVSDDGIGEIRWHNRVRGLQFQVTAPPDCRTGSRHATLRVFVQGAPAGRIHFVIEVVAEGVSSAEAQPRGDEARRYRKAFISYASPDRTEVLKRVQILDLLRIEYFQDLLNLNPGERWRVALYHEIDACDLFLLFWSSAARDSEWIRRELIYALECQKSNFHGDPDIVPVIIEGPPPVPPPPELEGLHFNDKLIYFMQP